MKRTLRVMIGSAVALLLFVTGARTACAFIIDSFDVKPGEPNEVSVTAVAVAAGEGQFTPEWGIVVDRNGGYLGERDIYVVKSFGGEGKEVSASVMPGDGYLGYSEDSSSRGEVWVTWDSNLGGSGQGAKDEVDVDGLNSADFTVRGQDELAMSLYAPTAGNHSLALHIWDGNSDWTVTKTVVGGSALPQLVVFDYSEFTGIDWTDVGAVQLGWVTDPSTEGGATARFRYLETQDDGNPENVPEPGTMVLMGGLLGLGALNRFRKRLTGGSQPAAA